MRLRIVRDRAVAVCCYMACAFLLLCMTFSLSEAFTASTIGDHGNVTVMAVSGNYDENNPDGTSNDIPRQEIAKEFYRLHKDEYDFLVIFSNFDFRMRDGAIAFYKPVKNDTRGTGQQLFDHTSLSGSSGKLQGTIDMGNISALTADTFESDFEHSLDTLSHELMHRWAAFIKFINPDGSLNSRLLGKDDSHWSYLLNTGASLMYGNAWQDNGDGTFTSIAARKYYSLLDLYLMGFIDKSEVPPMLLIDNPDIDPKKMPETGITITGTPSYVTIDDIIAAEGERIPSPAASQKSFKTAFIFITAPGTFTGDELYWLENIRNGWITRYSVLTDGRGIMEVAATQREDIPTNPGTTLPPNTPRTVPANVEDGVTWLMNNQRPDGNWFDITETAERDTAEAALSLKDFTVAQHNFMLGLQWLNSAVSENTDYLSRKIEVLAQAGQDVTPLLQTLISRQNSDGGWGSAREYASSVADTTFALKALFASGNSDQQVITSAINYLKIHQASDGGWGDNDSEAVQTTANVLLVFSRYSSAYQVNDNIAQAVSWLVQKQNPDGGFGNSPSTIYDTARTLLTLGAFDLSQDITNRAVQYILSSQSENGSWRESPYQTALAIEAVWKATVEPDLSIKNDDITFIPANVSILPSNIVISAAINNAGRTGVPAARVALYEGSVAEINKIGEQTLAFPGQSSVNVTFNATARDGSEHRFYIVVDPEDQVKEPNESDNVALKILYPEATYDFEILSANISVSESAVDIFNDVKITSKITNKGTMNAYNVQIKYFINNEGEPFDIATSTVDIPAGVTITNEVVWKTNKAGINLPLTLLADPFNTYAELSEENNKAVSYLTVNGASDANITISYRDMVITPNPAHERGNATISALIKNEGFAPADNIVVHFYKGVPDSNGDLLGSRIIPVLGAGESIRVDLEWSNIIDAGEQIIYVRVDPGNQITEITKDDNDAFLLLDILSLPDLQISPSSIVFNPSAPKDGDSVAINVTVNNSGRQNAANVVVKAFDGASLIGTKAIPVIEGNTGETVSFLYDTTGKSGAHEISVQVDPDGLITEQSDDNNSASKTLGVQNANLWLTEQYISPNGDGIKDSTQFFFRLNTQTTIKVLAVNSSGKAVRTFSGDEFVNLSAGNIIWDGRNDTGAVVDDGQYHLKVIDSSNTVIGSLLVVVDNNRSPLTDALETKYLLNNNLTCMLPDVRWDKWQWLPNDSGIIFSINSQNPNTPEYAPGLYSMGPDGDGVSRIIPFPSLYGHSVRGYSISPDGEKVAILTSRLDEPTDGYIEELWIKNINDGGIALVDYRESCFGGCSQGQAGFETAEISWSPDSKQVAYVTWSWGPTIAYTLELWIRNTDNNAPQKIDAAKFFGYNSQIEWSSDSSKIAYWAITDNNGTGEIRISDMLGNKMSISELHYGDLNGMYWMSNKQLLIIERTQNHDDWSLLHYTMKLYDPAGSHEPVLISDRVMNFTVSYDKSAVVFLEYTQDTVSVSMSDNNGNIYPLYKSDLVIIELGEGFGANIGNVLWSKDSKQIAFVNITYDIRDECTYEPALIVIDSESKNVAVTKSESICNYAMTCSWSDYQACLSNNYSTSFGFINWYSDNKHATIRSENKLFLMNIETGERKGSLPEELSRSSYLDTSPLERHITYMRNVEQGSACYGKGYYDLWTLSSMLNLTADLFVIKKRTSVLLKGIAADLNFEGYRLEYADSNRPDLWTLIQPPSDVMVLNDTFTTWVPPYEGRFIVRLTVWDKAGNVAESRKRVSWGLSLAITNIYKSAEIFSPNNDGIKDTLSLNYTVLEPLHLEIRIYDETNTLVRTYYRDYAAQSADSISWDGRDESDHNVQDGTYTIRILDFEFSVKVDNTPPDLNIRLSDVSQELNQIDNTMPLIVKLNGYAYDKNLSQWFVEYEAENNLGEWVRQFSGHDPLAGRDQDGNPIPDVLIDSEIQRYVNQEIAHLAGKRFRITVEDHAGNRRTLLSSIVEESVLLYFHSWCPDFPCNNEYINVNGKKIAYVSFELPLVHEIEGITTVKTPLSTYKLQYWSNLGWNDAAVEDHPSAGQLYFAWDRSKILENIYAIRIKTVDVYGQEHYSNTVPISESFVIDPCTSPGPWAENYLLEELEKLTIQIISSQDRRYAEWTELAVYEAPNVPRGSFMLPSLSEADPYAEYFYRMTGISKDGNTYTSEEDQDVICDSETEKIQIILSANNYTEADECEKLSDGITRMRADLQITGRLSSRPLVRKSLSFSIERPEGRQLLHEIDLTRENRMDFLFDTKKLPEGLYKIIASLTYLDTSDFSEKRLEAEDTLIVDRLLPEAKLIYPDSSQLICTSTKFDKMGSWRALSIEGTASDNQKVDKYELYYASEDNAKMLSPALTRVIKNYDIKLVPIIGNSALKGKVGDWHLKGLEGFFDLTLKVIDRAGNVSCHTTSARLKQNIDIERITGDKPVFSPNGDGLSDILNVSYDLHEAASVDARVYSVTRYGADLLLSELPAATLASGIQHSQGEGFIEWDGMTDAGIAADGMYAVALSASDFCSNHTIDWISIEVDNTPPASVIAFPSAMDSISNIVTILGTAMDLHFSNYVLEAGQGSAPEIWTTVEESNAPVSSGILGIWNTSGLIGDWTLRLTSYDTAGNRSSTSVTLNLGPRTGPIRNLSVLPQVFSPNNDGISDRVRVSYELSDSSEIQIDIVDSSGFKKRYFAGSAVAGSHTFDWDGRDNSGALVADGPYIIKLAATGASDPSVRQAEEIIVFADASPPVINIDQPLNNAFFKDRLTVYGSVTDAFLSQYTAVYSNDAEVVTLESGNQNRDGYVFGTLNSLEEGNYTLTLRAADLAGNISEKNSAFVIDRTPPKITLNSPADGDTYGNSKSIISIEGRIVESNLDTYVLRYGAGEDPAQWTLLQSETVLPLNQQLFNWRIGKHDKVGDGLYTLSLFVTDRAGWHSEEKRRIYIDNTAPDVIITVPKSGDLVRSPLRIKGTVSDANLLKYTLDISEGNCSAAYKWAPLITGTGVIINGDIGALQSLPDDGNYCLRLTAIDKVGNSEQTMADITIDTLPPLSPLLSGAIESQKNCRLAWSAGRETDISGFELYRDGQKLNGELVKDLHYTDHDLLSGRYTYTVKAVDLAGNTSSLSNEYQCIIDFTAPEARLRSPRSSDRVGGIIDIKGTAYSTGDFREYRVYIGAGASPSSWSMLKKSAVSMSYGLLAEWDTYGLADEQTYAIRLEAEDLSGNSASDQMQVIIDNTPPLPPVLLSAEHDGQNADLSWQVNSESDISGYLLFRNDQLANATEPVSGSFYPYLLTEPVYSDSELPDGSYYYYLLAMDRAGNLSEQSNIIELTIDTHPPHMVIEEPLDGSKFDGKISLRAISPDSDIESVQFMYRRAGATEWINLGSPLTNSPFSIDLDPAALGLSYGDFNLMAVSRDLTGNEDPVPAITTVTFTDLTPPAVPADLKAVVSRSYVTLTWSAVSDADLDGYHVYYMTGYGTWKKLNANVILDTDFIDEGLRDGSYSYRITAIDYNGNESLPSGAVSVRIYAPVIDQPHTPSIISSIQLTGRNAEPGSSVELFNDTGSGRVSIGKTQSTSEGSFTFNLTLFAGENRLTVRATDMDGNLSRTSAAVVVTVVIPPTSPAGLAVSVQDKVVSLTWDANTEPDLGGYNVYQLISGQWIRVNSSLHIGTAFTITDLANGSYTFRVTAVDTEGNEGLPSDAVTVNVAVPDTDDPPIPVILHPTISGHPIVADTGKIDIGGMAEPDTAVVLFRNGSQIAATMASRDYEQKQYLKSEGSDWDFISPDGNRLIYWLNDAMWLWDLQGDTKSKIADYAYPEGWSPNGRSFSYVICDSACHMQILDLNNGSSTPLTGDTDADEFGPSWSPDAKQVAYLTNRSGTYDIWLKDLVSGSMVQVTSGIEILYVRFSPDGSRLLYSANKGLYIYEIAGAVVSSIDPDILSYTGEWTSDGRFIYIDYATGVEELIVMDIASREKTALPDLVGSVYYLSVSPDDRTAAVGVMFNELDYSVLLLPLNQGGSPITVQGGMSDISALSWLKSGLLAVGTEHAIDIIQPKGYFRFENIALEPGDNIFSAVSQDDSGNVSQPSDEISVLFNADQFPDIVTTTEDMYIYPAVPITGQKVSINIAVWNRGGSPASDVEADVYMTDAHGVMTLIESVVIPRIDADGGEIIGVSWDSSGNTGRNTITVILDPMDKIPEAATLNNYAFRELIVVERQGILMTTSLSSDQLQAATDLTIDIDTVNSSNEKTARFEVTLEDMEGYPVSVLYSDNIVLTYGYHEQHHLNWNSGSFFAGSYRVHSILKDGSEIMAENIVLFSLLPDIAVNASVNADRTLYGPNETVVLGCDVANTGLNAIIANMKAAVRIIDASGAERFRTEREIIDTMPGTAVSFEAIWNTGLNNHGRYEAVIELSLNGEIISESSSNFEIRENAVIAGSIRQLNPIVAHGNQVIVDYTVTNTGNSDRSNVLLGLLVIDSSTADTVKSFDNITDLPIGGTASRQISFDTQDLELKNYVIALHAESSGSIMNIASASLTVIDITPPAVNVLSPIDNRTYGDVFDLSVMVTDDISGVDTVLYQIDGGGWNQLPLSDAVAGRYSITRTPADELQGAHIITLSATDRAGNTATIITRYTWNSDQVSPVSSISLPIDGSSVMASTVIVSGTASDVGSVVQKVEISTDGGENWHAAAGTSAWNFAWAVPADGVYTIQSRAVDSAGNIEMPGSGVTVSIYPRDPSHVTTSGRKVLLNEDPFTIKGVVYSPVPVGSDPETIPPYGDYFTAEFSGIYNRDLPLLRQMGANAIRLLTWNNAADHHDFLDAAFNGGINPVYIIPEFIIHGDEDIDPDSPGNARDTLKADFRAMVAKHKNHPAILMWMLRSDIPADFINGGNTSDLFSLINEMAAEAHTEEGNGYHPVSAALEDIDLAETIAQYDSAVPHLDIWGASVFRGNTFGSLFSEYQIASSKPFAVFDYGIDAFDNAGGYEYDAAGLPYQETYARDLWNEIVEHSDICIGGTITEYSDEWWRGKDSGDMGCSDNSPDIQSACGYPFPAGPDEFDNLEWWGIMRAIQNASGPDTVEARAVYYMLQELWSDAEIFPVISVSPSAVDFGSLTAGNTSLSQDLIVSNRGTGNLHINDITLAGDHPGEFLKQNDLCSGRTLIPGRECTVRLIFSPSTAGSRNSVLMITSDDGNGTANIPLSGIFPASISGTVTSGGIPSVGVTVLLEGGISATTVTDEFGNYIFSNLDQGSYRIEPMKTGYIFTPDARSVAITGQNIENQDFSEEIMTFSISPEAGNGGIVSPSDTQTVDYGRSASFVIAPNEGYQIDDVTIDGISVGPVSSYTFSDIRENHTILANFTRFGIIKGFGIFGGNGIAMSGGSYIDSYDSLKGAYSKTRGSKGFIGTSSLSNGAITLGGGIKIFGDVRVGVGGNPSGAIRISGSPTISGNMGALNSEKKMPVPLDPGGGIPITLKKGTLLTSGTYRATSVNLTGSATATIRGAVTLYVDKGFSISGSAQLVILPGSSLTLYVNGNISMSGAGIVNKSLNPHAVTIYGTSKCTTVNYSGSSSFYGVIYAPKANISVSGSSTIYGALAGLSVSVSGAAAIHYDESL